MNAIAQHAGHRLRHHAREVWESRGGGFYGFVAMLTFLYLEAVNLVGDVTGITHLQINLGGIISWLVQNFVQGLLNVMWAAIWPVEWIKLFGVGLTSGALLGGAYIVYHAIHPGVRRLLESGDEAAAAPSPGAGRHRPARPRRGGRELR